MRTLPRRVFLQDSAALAAGMATIAGLAGADAPREDKADNKPVGPNDTLRVAVCGVHGRGMDHVAGWSKLNDVRITTICDVDLNATGRARKAIDHRYGAEPTVVQDIRRLLDDKSIDAISIATPNHWHALAAIWACQAGKDVYVEKPVSHNVTEGRRIVEAARKYDRIVQTGTQCRSHQGIQDAVAFCARASSGRSTWPKGFVTNREDRSGTSPMVPSQKKSTTTSGSARPPNGHSTPTASTTTGTGIGTTATATSATRASIRWTWLAGD
jgi:Oxidoreductase family, NAD-binding Rossmann fold